MPEQCVDTGFAAAEGLEGVDGRARAADRKDLVEEAPADRGVGRQYFRPLVAEIAGAVTAAENVREAVREAVPGRRDEDGNFLTYFAQQVHDALRAGRVEARVQQHVEQRELDLAHRHHAALE